MTRVLLTGATGMIGAAVLQRLRRDGTAVRALAREGSDISALQAAGAEIERLGPEGQVPAEAFRGVDSVVHAAGALSTGSAFSRGDPAAAALYQAVNVGLTERIVEGARVAGLRRLVFVSSCAVYGMPTSDRPIGEDHPLEPPSDYGASKLAAERCVAAAQGAGLSTTIVRPSIVTGVGDRHFAPAAAALARLPVLPLASGGRGRIELAHADDIADLIVLCLQHEAADGRVYNATSGVALALRDIVDGLARRLDLRPRILNLSPAAMALARPAFAFGLRRLGPAALPLLGPQALRYLDHDAAFSIARARDELGFVPAHSADSVLDALAASTRAQL